MSLRENLAERDWQNANGPEGAEFVPLNRPVPRREDPKEKFPYLHG